MLCGYLTQGCTFRSVASHALGLYFKSAIIDKSFSYPCLLRAEGKIKHCRIEKDGRLFIIGSAEFETLTELVEYYMKFPLYRKMKLQFPVNEEVLAEFGVSISVCIKGPNAPPLILFLIS